MTSEAVTTDKRVPSYPDEAAFPQPALMRSTTDQRADTLLVAQWGLTKRELFAAMALQGLLAGPDYDPTGPIARAAVDHADELLKELAK